MEISPRPQSGEQTLSNSSNTLDLVRSVWQDVLDFDPDDDTGFFDSGGDSHLLFVLVDRLSKTSGLKLKTIDVLKADTISGQAALLRRLKRMHTLDSPDAS